jgi:hypothetical protein
MPPDGREGPERPAQPGPPEHAAHPGRPGAGGAALTRWSLRPRAVRGWQRIRACRPRTILAIGFAVFVIYGFPGYMSNDSVDQLVEARTRLFSDGHPPIMAAEWAVLDSIVSGPFLMLVVQGGVLLAGLHALLGRLLSPRRAAVVAVAVFLFPPVATTMAVIWKDSQMAAYLTAGIACLTSPRRRTRLIGLALLAVGCAFRHNAPAAALPLIVLVFEWRPGSRGWRRYALAAVAFAAVAGASVGVTRALAVVPMRTPMVTGMAVNDIVGVLRYTRDRSDDDLREVLRGTPLLVTHGIQARARAGYSPRNYYDLIHGDGALFDAVPTPDQIAALVRAWRELALDDVGAYLRHRAAVSAELLGLSSSELWSPVYTWFVVNAGQSELLKHQARASYLQRKATRRLGRLADHTWLFRAYVYAAVALALLVVAAVSRDRLALALLLSGLAYELTFCALTASPDFRYSHWMIVCTCLAAIRLFVRRWRAGVAVGHPAAA